MGFAFLFFRCLLLPGGRAVARHIHGVSRKKTGGSFPSRLFTACCLIVLPVFV